MEELKLYMLLLGCRPAGRHTEQHDIFFGIATSLGSLIPAIIASWPEAKGKIHIDAWRYVTRVDGFDIRVKLKDGAPGGVHPEAAVERPEVAGSKMEHSEASETRVLNAGGAGFGVSDENRLYFINLGGYKPNEFEEYHYKMVVAGANKGIAVQKSKETAFYKHTGFKGATSHIDDKYGIDVDDTHAIEDILPDGMKETYSIVLAASDAGKEDEMHLGYLKLSGIAQL
jgi:hypothetical protein